MCTILIGWRLWPDTPVLVAANRDELRSRPAAPPRVIGQVAGRDVMGGTDLLAGGTWLATDSRAVAAVTNRHLTEWPVGRDPGRRSRGELPLALLEMPAGGAADAVAALPASDYNPVNVLLVSSDMALWAHLDDHEGTVVSPLEPGIHVMTVSGLYSSPQAPDPKARHLLALARAAAGATAAETEAAWLGVLADHTSPTGREQDRACIHASPYGTVSASAITLGAQGLSYRHCQGLPCTDPWAVVSTSGRA